METKFKVGDKVRLLDGSGIKDFTGDWVGTMESDIGHITTIRKTVPKSHGIWLKDISWIWDDRCVELVESAPDTNVGGKISKRAELLEGAKNCICKDRDIQYSPPENSFSRIAEYWNLYLGLDREITAKDVGIMMALFKISRIDTGHHKDDNYIDCIGYIACAGELENENINKGE